MVKPVIFALYRRFCTKRINIFGLILDDLSFKNMIVWLEDQKIRHYKVEDRTSLRQINATTWKSTYDKYLQDLDCPIKSGRKEEELEWLLTFSVSLEFSDNVEKYQAKPQSYDNVPKVTSENPLDNLDFSSQDFIKGVNQLAETLNVDPQPDPLLTLQAVSKLVTSRLNEKALKDPESIAIKVRN